MLSILNILKKHQEEKKDLAGMPGRPPEGRPSGPVNFPGVPAGLADHPRRLAAASANLLPVVDREIALARLEDAKRFYRGLVDLTKKTYHTETAGPLDLKAGFADILEKELAWLNSDLQELLQISIYDYEGGSFDLHCHAVNVSIIALEVGRELNYDKRQLFELGVASLLHDIGMVRYLELINKSGRLSDEELRMVREHPLKAAEVLNRMGGEIPPWLTGAVTQEHERLDGSGYPNSLKGDQICETAQIIGLADVYEAMIHSRPYRERYSPPKAMNMILGKKDAFSARALKAFLERIGVFPVGTTVRLNTKEVGMVCAVNRGLPLRPRVLVMFDENSNRLEQARQVDLSANLLVCIEECLDAGTDKTG